MNRDLLEHLIAECMSEQNNLYAKRRPIDQALEGLSARLRELREESGRLRVAEMGDTPDWPYIVKAVASDDTSSQALLEYTERHLRETFAMWHSGHWMDTQEARLSLKIRFHSRESYAKNLAGVKYFASILTPHAEDGLVWFDVFEHTCDRYGSLTLAVKPDLSLVLVGRQPRTMKPHASIESALKYIQDFHWYDKGPNDE